MQRAKTLYSEKVGGGGKGGFRASRGWLHNFMKRQKRVDMTRQERRDETRDECEEDVGEVINREVQDTLEDEDLEPEETESEEGQEAKTKSGRVSTKCQLELGIILFLEAISLQKFCFR